MSAGCLKVRDIQMIENPTRYMPFSHLGPVHFLSRSLITFHHYNIHVKVQYGSFF